jgi:hypothetical protein
LMGRVRVFKSYPGTQLGATISQQLAQCTQRVYTAKSPTGNGAI